MYAMKKMKDELKLKTLLIVPRHLGLMILHQNSIRNSMI